MNYDPPALSSFKRDAAELSANTTPETSTTTPLPDSPAQLFRSSSTARPLSCPSTTSVNPLLLTVVIRITEGDGGNRRAATHGLNNDVSAGFFPLDAGATTRDVATCHGKLRHIAGAFQPELLHATAQGAGIEL